jgi:zinc transport system substrate-binding protein
MILAPRLLVPMMVAAARPAALVALLMVAAIGLSRPAWAADPGGRPLSVFTTVVPLATFVERIGGDQVRVQALVRPGQNPHAYEPSPRQIAALADADLYVRVGMSLEDAWLPRIRAANARMRVLDARDNIRLRPRDAAPAIDDPRGLADHDHESQRYTTAARRRCRLEKIAKRRRRDDSVRVSGSLQHPGLSR